MNSLLILLTIILLTFTFIHIVTNEGRISKKIDELIKEFEEIDKAIQENRNKILENFEEHDKYVENQTFYECSKAETCENCKFKNE